MLIFLVPSWDRSVSRHLRLMSLGLLLAALFSKPKKIKFRVQTRVFKSLVPSEDDPCIVYHGITDRNRLGEQINYKISPLKGFFTFDPQGYSGFGMQPKERARWLEISDGDVKKRALFLKKRNFGGKYERITKNLENREVPPGLILVEQLDDDQVSSLRLVSDVEMEKIAQNYAAAHNLTVAWRRHPFGGRHRDRNYNGCSLDSAIKSGSIFFTHNSGLAAEVMIKGGTVIFFAPNEFVGKSFVFRQSDLTQTIEELLNPDFRQKQLEEFDFYLGALVRWHEFFMLTNIIKKFERNSP